MQVFKFGGASIRDEVSIKNVGAIIHKQGGEAGALMVVVSAMGKTTNALEAVLAKQVAGDLAGAKLALAELGLVHHRLAQNLGLSEAILDELHDVFVEAEWVLEDPTESSFDYRYDQLIATGELASSLILWAYLGNLGLRAHWLDARDCIKTDNSYREAKVDWALTEGLIQQQWADLGQRFEVVVTQGFIGSSSENFNTSLGREGSDYTAAIFAYALKASCMTVWKDVAGVLTADPRRFEQARLLPRVSYQEAIEMTYYGAQVIHPKTLQPLKRGGIPMRVRCFLDPEAEGTRIEAFKDLVYPLCLVLKPRQVLLRLRAKDFHFVDENRYGVLFERLGTHGLKVNLTQNTALAFSIVVNHQAERLAKFLAWAEAEYEVEKVEDLCLLTLRHGSDADFEAHKQGKDLLMEQRIGQTAQLLYRGGDC